MTLWRKFFNYKYLSGEDLEGKEHTVEIESIKEEEVEGEKGRKEMCLVMRMKGANKGIVLNKTNSKRIARVAGSPHIEDWIGKKIKIHGEEVSAFGTTTCAVRVLEQKVK